MTLTKDEKFLIAIYELAEQTGDIFNDVDRYAVGKTVGINPKGVDTICKLLLQANFIKKRGPAEIYLTQHGCNLIQQLLSES